MNAKNLPDWVKWLAQDADGSWWGYEVEPLQHFSGWYENEVGQYIRIEQGAQRTSNADWRGTLLHLNS